MWSVIFLATVFSHLTSDSVSSSSHLVHSLRVKPNVIQRRGFMSDTDKCSCPAISFQSYLCMTRQFSVFSLGYSNCSHLFWFPLLMPEFQIVEAKLNHLCPIHIFPACEFMSHYLYVLVYISWAVWLWNWQKLFSRPEYQNIILHLFSE